jgi:hypothetical protein
MTYPLLENAPPQDTDAFIDYLRDNNVVVMENNEWIVIENCKYHRAFRPWLTAFWKVENPDGRARHWFDDLDVLWYEQEWYLWEWRKKAVGEQSVPGRFHIHLIGPEHGEAKT